MEDWPDDYTPIMPKRPIKLWRTKEKNYHVILDVQPPEEEIDRRAWIDPNYFVNQLPGHKARLVERFYPKAGKTVPK